MKHSIPDAVLKNHIAVLGKTGSGKTSTEKLLVEQVVAENFRVCILDSVKSDWWGITSSANGKQAGLPFKILGGPRGHVPLHSSAGKVIGQLVGTGKLPLSIIDMADFEAGGLQRFFIDFAQALMRNARGVVYLVIEEAHELAPKERSGVGYENMAIHWAKKLATAGRSKGIRLIVATQRTQAIHNAILGSCETIIAHRLSAPADQEPIIKWLKANTDKETQEKVASSLSSLPTGTGWICSGEAKIFQMEKFPKFKTYDNTATPIGDTEEITVKTAPVNPDELRSIIGDAVKEAEANDPVMLRKEISYLQKQISSTKTASVDPAALKESELSGFRKGKIAGYSEGIRDCMTEINKIVDDQIKKFSGDIKSVVGGIIEQFSARAKHYGADALPFKAGASTTGGMTYQINGKKSLLLKKDGLALKDGDIKSGQSMTVDLASGEVDHDLNGPQKRIVNSLRFWKSIGYEAPTREQVAAVAGYSAQGGAFGVPTSQLSTMGIVGKPRSGALSLIKDVGGTEIDAKTNLLSILDGPQKRLLNSFLEHEPTETMTRAEVAQRANYGPDGGAFGVPASKLCTLGIFEKPESGKLKMSDWALKVLAQ